MVRVIFILLALFQVAATARVEEQRKYVVPNQAPLPETTFTVGDFRFWPHDVYLTDDIYFDSADGILVHAGLGLRLRRVRKGALAPQYVVQLKSEMETPGAPRIEEEERDLAEQRIGQVRLIDVIDRCVAQKKVSPADAHLLSQWFQRKAISSLAPFQELRRRRIEARHLVPVVVGFSHRRRYHILVDRNERVSPLLLLKDSEKNELRVPPIFRQHPSWVWLMEASWDEARFVPAAGGDGAFVIKELEIENKYRPREMGTILMDKLEALLLRDRGMTPGLESKFFRARHHFVKDKK